jgi:hypothetical protein
VENNGLRNRNGKDYQLVFCQKLELSPSYFITVIIYKVASLCGSFSLG